MANNQRIRNWCFTIHNYTENDLTHLKNLNTDNIKHLIFQEEMCPTTERKHIQGHICLKNARTMTGVKKLLNNETVHLEIMRGTPKQSAAYCSKSKTAIEGTNHEYGELPSGQGTRSDIAELIERINNKELKYDDIVNEYPVLFLQYRLGLREICDKVYGTKRDSKSFVTVLYGASGTGKSRDAFNNEDCYILRASKTGVWFDGYDYNKTLIIDDFYGWIPFNQLLNLLDRYAMKVDIKGGAKEFNSPNIVITSNKSPLEWYPNLSDEHKIALLRRIEKCIYYNRKETIDVSKGLLKKIEELADESGANDNDELVCLSLMEQSRTRTEVGQGNTILDPALPKTSTTTEIPNIKPLENIEGHSYPSNKPISNGNDSCACSEEDTYCEKYPDDTNDSSAIKDKYGRPINDLTCYKKVNDNGDITYYRRDTNEAVFFISKKYNRGAPIYDITDNILSYDWDSDEECVCLS